MPTLSGYFSIAYSADTTRSQIRLIPSDKCFVDRWSRTCGYIDFEPPKWVVVCWRLQLPRVLNCWDCDIISPRFRYEGSLLRCCYEPFSAQCCHKNQVLFFEISILCNIFFIKRTPKRSSCFFETATPFYTNFSVLTRGRRDNHLRCPFFVYSIGRGRTMHR